MTTAAGLAGIVASPVASAGAREPEMRARSRAAFLAVGDWGSGGSPGQREVASAMAAEAARIGAQFVVSTGDNFYSRGVAGFDDPLWRTAFEDVYTAASLQCPWYPVLGNHDRRGNAMAQIAYSEVSARWRMPAAYYTRGVQIGEDRADFFFLDTDMICRETSSISDVLSGDDADDQLAWLSQALAASPARWKIVVGHHPVLSGGQHGGTPAMQQVVEPILRSHRVLAYVSGHDHCLQHIVSNGLHHLTSGTGARVKDSRPVEGTRFVKSALGFMAGEATSSGFVIRFLGTDGQELYAAEIA